MHALQLSQVGIVITEPALILEMVGEFTTLSCQILCNAPITWTCQNGDCFNPGDGSENMI